MTLIAVLLLYPTPMVYTGGLDHSIPRDQPFTRAAAPVIRYPWSVFLSGDSDGGAGCEDEEWGDGEGADALLGWPALSRRFHQDYLPSRPLSSPWALSCSLRSRHLRC
jgi:hypothetical protein